MLAEPWLAAHDPSHPNLQQIQWDFVMVHDGYDHGMAGDG
jgi:hypothetical protein